MLIERAPGLWTHDFIQPFLGIAFPTRMTLARLPDGTLWMHAPGPIDDALAAEIATRGEVAHLVTPSNFHDSHLHTAAARYPEASVSAPPKLEGGATKLDCVLGRDPVPWSDAIAAIPLAGIDRMAETVFLHRASDTLVCTDLLMHGGDGGDGDDGGVGGGGGLGFQVAMRLEGAWKRLSCPRLVKYVLMTDRAVARKSVEAVLEWAPERIVLAHGRCVERDGAAVLARAMDWLVPAS